MITHIIDFDLVNAQSRGQAEHHEQCWQDQLTNHQSFEAWKKDSSWSLWVWFTDFTDFTDCFTDCFACFFTDCITDCFTVIEFKSRLQLSMLCLNFMQQKPSILSDCNSMKMWTICQFFEFNSQILLHYEHMAEHGQHSTHRHVDRLKTSLQNRHYRHVNHGWNRSLQNRHEHWSCVQIGWRIT